VDATTPNGAGTVNTANVAVSGAALDAIGDAHKSAAWPSRRRGHPDDGCNAKAAIVENAKAGADSPASAVTLCIEKKDTASAVSYTLCGERDGQKRLSEDNADGRITVSVPYSGSDTPHVYYLGETAGGDDRCSGHW
jgi:hypothetical protein